MSTLYPEYQPPTFGARIRQLWSSSERFRGLVRGLPALFGGLAVFVMMVQVRLSREEDLVVRYRMEADRLGRARDFEAALVCDERLTLMKPETPDFVFLQSLALRELGEVDRAVALASKIAPLDRRGFAPAHLWIANRLLQNPARTAADVRAAEVHLKHYLRASVGSANEAEAREILGELYRSTDRPEEAEGQLKRVASERPALLLPLAWACRVQGKTLAARNWAEQSAAHFQGLLKRDAGDENARFRAALSLVFLERFPEAEKLLLQGLAQRRELRYHGALAELYVAWSDLARRNNQPIAMQVELLERGLTHDPANRVLMDRMLSLSKSENAEGAGVESALRAALAGGRGVGVVHFVLGIDAWKDGRPEEAKLHWEEARRVSPEMPIVANNLAWVIAFGPHSDRQQALALMNTVIARWPEVAAFRDTRGAILVKLEQWAPARADLEVALRLDPNIAGLHASLATTYEHLGMRERAEEHRRLAGPKDDRPAIGAR